MSDTSQGDPGVRGEGRLGRAERLTHRSDFARLRKTGKRGGDDVVRVLVGPNGLGWSRLACAISRRYGKAHDRNRLRRLYRAAFQQEKRALPPGYDILVSPPRNSTAPDLDTLRGALVKAVRQAVRRLERQRPPSAEPT